MKRLPTLRAAAAAALLTCAGMLPASAQATEDVAYIRSEETRRLGLPFSDLVRVGDVLYLSGMVGFQPGTVQLVPGGIVPETRAIFDAMRRLLEANGSSLERVFKCTIMIEDIAEWARFNEVYVEYFRDNLPARSALGADGLALGARVEVECWAHAGPD